MLSAGGMLVVGCVMLGSPSLAAASTGCGYGNSSGNIRSCLSVGLSGASATAQVISSARVVNVCLYINGRADSCSGYTYLPAGQSTGVGDTWVGVAPSATYCAVTWKKAPDGSVTLVDQECWAFFHG
jgi:hypothetical protein